MNALLLIIISLLVGAAGWFAMAFVAARRTVKSIVQPSPKEEQLKTESEQRKQRIDDDMARRVRDAYSAPRDNVIHLFRDRMFPKGPKPGA